MNFTWDLLHTAGFIPKRIVLSDSYGNTYDKLAQNEPKCPCSINAPSVDRMLFVKDRYCIGNEAYQEITLSGNNLLPSLYTLQNRTEELNSMFNVQVNDEHQFVWEPLEGKLVRAVRNMIALFPQMKLQNGDKMVVKITGDGTSFGSRKSVTNIGFVLIFGNYQSPEHVLALTHQPEKFDALKPLFSEMNLSEEIEKVKILSLDEQTIIHLDYVFCADLKFINEMMGLGSCASTYACAWCKCPESQFWDMSISWSMTDVTLGARTIQEIDSESKKTGKRKDHFACLRSPMLCIEVAKVIMDPLHMFLRVSDQLIRQLVKDTHTQDKVKKNQKNVDLTKCVNMKAFEKFVQDLGIQWKFTTDKTSGLLTYRDFVGPEHKKIQRAIDLRKLIPWHQKLDKVVKLWEEFPILMAMMKSDLDSEGLDRYKERAQAWVSLFKDTYLAKDVTIYMHIMAKHVEEAIRLHGSLKKYSQQGFEKLNDFLTKWFFHSSDHKGLQALKQVMDKANRVEYLYPTCKRDKVFEVTCSNCHEKGHNKRTCCVEFNLNEI